MKGMRVQLEFSEDGSSRMLWNRDERIVSRAGEVPLCCPHKKMNINLVDGALYAVVVYMV